MATDITENPTPTNKLNPGKFISHLLFPERRNLSTPMRHAA